MAREKQRKIKLDFPCSLQENENEKWSDNVTSICAKRTYNSFREELAYS